MPSSRELLISDGQQVLARVPLGMAPQQMALDESAGRLYVTVTSVRPIVCVTTPFGLGRGGVKAGWAKASGATKAQTNPIIIFFMVFPFIFVSFLRLSSRGNYSESEPHWH